MAAPVNETTDAFVAQKQIFTAAGVDVRTVVDGGAFVGEITAAYLATFPESHVWAVEPAPHSIAALQAPYAGEPRVTLVPAALAAAAGSATLSINGAEATDSLLPLDAASAEYLDYPVATLSSNVVNTIDVDSLCRAQGIERLSILKLDIQGTEMEVLAGARRLLAEERIDPLFTEFNFVSVYQRQTQTWTLLQELASHG